SGAAVAFSILGNAPTAIRPPAPCNQPRRLSVGGAFRMLLRISRLFIADLLGQVRLDTNARTRTTVREQFCFASFPATATNVPRPREQKSVPQLFRQKAFYKDEQKFICSDSKINRTRVDASNGHLGRRTSEA